MLTTPTKTWRRCVVLVAVIHHLVGGVASYTLSVSPTRVRVHQNVSTDVTITCTADTPLAACQMSWWAEKDAPGPVLDLSGGAASPRVEVKADGVLGYSYQGRGLAAGDCGVTLTLLGKKVWTVGCRVRAAAAAGGGWRYKTMDLLAYSTEPLAGVEVESNTVIVLPGREASLLCTSPGPVDACYISLPGRVGYLDFYAGLESGDSAGRYVYRGAGRESGDCGLTWRDMTEADNGPVRCYLWKSPRFADNRGIDVIVARAPNNPVLQVNYDGTTLRATCTVDGGRPAPKLQWRLGDDVIRNDDVVDAATSPDDAWTWPWSVTSATQTLTRSLVPGDYGKTLKCVTSHPALEQPLEARLTLTESGDERPSGSGPSLNSSRSQTTQRACAALPDASCACRSSVDDEELRQLRLREAKAALTAAELAERAGLTILEAARSSARAEEARARAEEARAREEEAWAENAAEELAFERQRRGVLGRKQVGAL